MQSLFKLLEKEYPEKFGQGCAAHVMNLLVKDISKIDTVSNTTNEAASVIKYINHHTKIKAKFDEAREVVEGVRSLQLSVPTRWHSLISSCKRIYAARHVINQVFEREESSIPSNIKEIVEMPAFWQNLKKIIETLEYPIQLLTRFEADDCIIDEVYAGFISLIEFYTSKNGTKLIDSKTLIKIVNDRWGFLNTEAHDFSFLLSPRNVNLFEKMPKDDYPRTIENFKSYCQKFYNDDKISSNAIQQFLKYLSDIQAADAPEYKLPPDQFWNIYGYKYKDVKKMALRILSIPVSSAAAERVWSVYGRIHTKYRGSLSNDKVEKLVYVRANLNLAQMKEMTKEHEEERSDSD